MVVKQLIRRFFNLLHLDVTKNLAYDRLTQKIIKSYLKPTSNCIDVGAHKGEILDLILKQAPHGTHFAFEPIPLFFERLKENYSQKVHVFPFALAEKSGVTSFNFVKNAPAYSGLKERDYLIEKPEIEQIEVELKALDEVIPADVKIDFIKIDVEGGEFDVLKGAQRILKEDMPIILFESGLGASEFYGTTPVALFEFFQKLGYQLFTLKNYVKSSSTLSKEEFKNLYDTNTEYYFVAENRINKQ